MRRRSIRRVLLVSAPSVLALFAPVACHGSASDAPIVVWIEVDTLRADALGCYGNAERGENGCEPSPHVDALARDGVRFERAYSAAPWTIPSLVTQLSGLWPWEHGETHLLDAVGEAHTELVPLLRSHGVRTAGVMTNFVAKRAQGFARGFERWDEELALGHEGSFAHEACARLLAFADELRADAPHGLLLFGWLVEPHYVYEAHPGFRFGPGFGARAPAPYAGTLRGDEPLPELLARRATLDGADRAFLRGNYASEVAFLDHAVGELVAGLKQRGIYDRAWIVFTADHGEELLDRGWIGHSTTLHEELVHVPLIVKPPRDVVAAYRGHAIDGAVGLIDLPATLHELLVGRAPDRAQNELGHSRSLVPVLLRDEPSPRRWLYLHTDFQPVVQDALSADKSALQWGVVDARRRVKWIVDRKDEAHPRASLYELDRDPCELRDVATDPRCAPIASEMQRLRALVPAPLDGASPAPAWLPEEEWGPRASGDDGLGPAFAGARR